MKVKISTHHLNMITTKAAESLEKIDLEKFEHLKPRPGSVILCQYRDKPEENKSEGGLILPGETEDELFVGVVVAVGEGHYNPYSGTAMPVSYSVGDLVFFKESFGHHFVFGQDREELLSIDVTDLVAKAI